MSLRIIHKHCDLSTEEEFFYSLGLGVSSAKLSDTTNPDDLVPLDQILLENWFDPEGLPHQGGLYPYGGNLPPTAHAKQIKTANKNIYPRNGIGVKDLINGKICLAIMGASNPLHIANYLIPAYQSDPEANNKVTIVNNGQEGMSIDKMFTTAYFSNCIDNIEANGLTAKQVQAVIFKTDTLGNDIDTLSFVDYVNTHKAEFTAAMQQILIDYPNCQIVYFVGRHTTRYAMPGYDKHFEPRAFYNCCIIKALIEDQIFGNPALKCKGAGKVAPVLAWGPSFYSNGPVPNSFGYSVDESSFTPAADGAINNGVHLSESGLESAVNYILDFFFNDTYTKNWFKS